jgi:hypothetical protein
LDLKIRKQAEIKLQLPLMNDCGSWRSVAIHVTCAGGKLTKRKVVSDLLLAVGFLAV